MKIKIAHKTEYVYSTPVVYALQKVRLRPLNSSLQDVLNWDITVTGGKHETQYLDHYQNHVDLFSIEPGAQALSIRAEGTVLTKPENGVLGMVYGRAPLWHFKQPTPQTTPGAAIQAMAQVVSNNTSQLDGLHELSRAILTAVTYQFGVTETNTTAEAALTGGRGVCQDHAQIFIAAARVAGIPARYVSGYLMMNDIVDQDATHAWAEAHVDGLGWVGFDISNGISPDERYVRIATGRDARDAAPVEGLRQGAADETLIVSLQVQQ
ncbi:transglutaminase domain-containing protein [Falsihalocynthiibacter sp. BN13B15]|uniref:transglutaminase family protein n=1 Tax=Falsihalocynthiibacter sp. BN13B15 TaxID=3240871 RepID=UPI00350FF3A7